MAFLIKMALFLEMLQAVAIALFRTCLHPRHRHILTAADVLIIFLIPLVGLFGYNKYVFYATLFVLPLFWIGNPTGLAKRYVLTLVLFPELQETFKVGSVYLGVFTSFLFLNAGALIALAMTRCGQLKPIRSVDTAIWLLFMVTLLTVARGGEIGGTIRYIATTFLLVIPPYYIVARTIDSERALGDTLSFVVLGGLCNAIVGMFESVKHWAMYEAFYQTLGVKIVGLSANLSLRAGLLRAGGEVHNYETLGLVTGTALLATLVLRQRFTQPGYYLVLFTLAGGLLVSQARSAWIAILIGVLLHAAFDRKWRRAAMIAGGISLAGALAFTLSSSGSKVGQLLGKGGHGESTLQYRQSLLNRGLQEVASHPLTGQTLDQLQVTMNDLRQGQHIIDFVNTHLLVTLVGGIGGLILWMCAWGTPMFQAWIARRRVHYDTAVSPGLSFALVGMTFVFLTFTSPVDRVLSLAAISMGLISVSIRLSDAALREQGGVLPVRQANLLVSSIQSGIPVKWGRRDAVLNFVTQG